MDEKNNSNSLFICILILAGILISIKLWNISNKINTLHSEILWGKQKIERFVSKNDDINLLTIIYNIHPDLIPVLNPPLITQAYQYYLSMTGKIPEEKFNQELYSVRTIQDYLNKIDILEIDKADAKLIQKINETSILSSSQSFLFWLLIMTQIINTILTLKWINIEGLGVK